jgi:actin beta/gamma 1
MPSYEEEEGKPHIVIDNGTSYCKAGLSGEEGPRAVFPTCVSAGYKIDKIEYAPGMVASVMVGANAKNKSYFLKLNYPIENGVIYNWDDMEKIWEHVFNDELEVAPEGHNVMLTEARMNPKESRKKMAQIMFETFNVPGLYIANQAVLSIYNEGMFTGIVADSGDGATHIVPIFDGYSLPHAVKRLNLTGKDLTEYIVKLLKEKDQIYSSYDIKDCIIEIKEKSCYVALDFEKELKSIEDFNYVLPDGSHVIVRDQRIIVPEALFKPSMIGKEGNGLGQTCYDSIQKCDIDIRKILYNCVVLSGGNSMFNGLPERLTKEIKALAPESMKEEVRIIASPERKFATWIGGSIISSISTFKSQWITKIEYEESGDTIVHRKCF